MTKLYGVTYTILNNNVIGFGKKCLCWNVYLAKVPKRRLKGTGNVHFSNGKTEGTQNFDANNLTELFEKIRDFCLSFKE